MSDSVRKFYDLVEEGRIKESPIYRYSCLCTNHMNCSACTQLKSYLVTQWVETNETKKQILYRFDNRTLDYIEGFIDALRIDLKTDKVLANEII